MKSLIVASSCSHLYLLIKDARLFEYKVNSRVYFRTVQRTHTNKDPPVYAAISPHTDVF